VVVIVPGKELPPATPFTSQVIVSVAAEQNDAAKACVVESATLAAAGEIELPVAQMIVTVALPLSAELSEFVAVTVTLAGEGTVAGAVYTAVAATLALPLEIMVPTAAFPPTTELTLHVKLAPAPDPPERLAEKICAPLVGMFTAPGENGHRYTP
jgi:hypothetical protein